ncbi:hypothetical protein VHUM_03233 [Vanrija humicola]|uniref:Conserved oligomeric Golgi complex subunit 1 n=1 Tax=Vanrija humicola TaxID=5417 RepID=A0A7D8UZM5_VANHU|nr:hypothetical protein VHUM_03233 [Vanrija humicola]
MSARPTPRRPSSSSVASAGPSSRQGLGRGFPHPYPYPGSSASSIAPPPRLGARRTSGLSTVKDADSESSASIPRRFRAAAAAGSNDDANWAGIEPDDVFRRLPVVEVRRVEGKMRADALNKQSELRSMVGTRYRDLLTSASQMTALHSSSLRLSSSLKTVAAACANPTELPAPDGTSVDNMLPVAAHLKLLLDAPEALYSYLAHHSYLNAAFLWLLSRVVKEGLTAMPDDVKGPYVPLLQKQWEALLPFRSQIVQRATASLRSRDAVDTKTLSDTTLAIVLLDSLPIPDVLDLYLSQRLKALKDHLAHVPPTGSRKRSNSKAGSAAATRSAAQQRDSIAHVLSDAIKCLLDAVEHARDVFEPKRRLSGTESVIAEAIRLVQAGEELPPTHAPRKTRMASISLPLPPANQNGLGGRGPPVSTPRILQALPSSQILLRYLPSGITGFTPFIAPSSEPELSKKLDAWQASAILLLRQSVPSWLADLQSVSDVWAVRSAIGDLLGDSAFEQQISQALEAEWGARVQTIWTAKLDALITNAETTLRTASEKIRAGEESLDNDPEKFIFSDIAFPPAPVSSIGAGTNSAAFNTFLSTVQKRASFRTPLLDSVLTVLESAASDLKADLAGLPETFYGEYRTKVTTALDAFVNSLGDVLAAVGGHRDATGSVEAELFVGRVALYVVHTSPFLTDLTGDTGVDLAAIKNELMEIHESSTSQWQEKIVATQVASLQPLFADHRGADEIRASWQGSHPTQPSVLLVEALTDLVKGVRKLGIPPTTNVPIVPNLLSAFTAEVRGLEGWRREGDEAVAQAAVDLGFLTLLKGDDVAKDEVVNKLLAKVALAELKSTLPAVLLESLRRTQLVLGPLIGHLARPTGANPVGRAVGADARNAALLRLGAPGLAARGAGVGADFKSPIAVAKPAKRFGLLSIVA